MMWNGFGTGGMWGFWLFGLLLLVGLVLLVVLAVRVLGGGISRETGTGASANTYASTYAGDRPQGRSRAQEVLDERYARGDFSTEEYRERLQTLGENA